MLSYRHAFHAGNFADILKHLVLVNTLHYAMRKDAPLFYLDTHAGAGLYHLDGEHAQTTGEAEAGIRKLDLATLAGKASDPGRSALDAYRQAVEPYLQRKLYPGSPLLAAELLRKQDHLHLCELHPTDFKVLQGNTGKDRRIHVQQADGYLGIHALLPPVQKRAVVLIDPSYELKEDYLQVVRALVEIQRRMAGAQVLLWYPVVDRALNERMLKALLNSDVRDLWQYELGVRPDTDEYGMTGCGMLVINPPWTLAAQLESCLPLVQQQLAPSTGYWLVRNLVAEH